MISSKSSLRLVNLGLLLTVVCYELSRDFWQAYTFPILENADNLLPASSTTTSWLEDHLSSCPILYHVHIPKTGGTSLLEALANVTNYIDHDKSLDRANVYLNHGKKAAQTLYPALQRALEKRNATNETSSPMVMSVELGLQDLRDYPYWSDTCFFAVIRDPLSWLPSAAAHSQERMRMRHGINGTTAFLDLPNIQAQMTGYSSGTLSSSAPMCVYTMDTIDRLLCALGQCTSLPHVNQRAYDAHDVAAVLQVVERRYSHDVELYRRVEEKGFLCWKHHMVEI